MNDYEIEILKYELQWIYLHLRDILQKMPGEYHDLNEFKN